MLNYKLNTQRYTGREKPHKFALVKKILRVQYNLNEKKDK